MAGIIIDAKVDRIQVPENLRYFRLIEEQQERCAEIGCQGDVFKFGLGQSPFPVPAPLQKALSLHSSMGSYAHPIGSSRIREAVADFYKTRFGLEVEPYRVITGHGAKGLIFSIFTLITGSVIIPSPGWLGYLPQLRILNVPYYRLYTHGAGNFKIRPQTLEAMLKGLVKTQHLLILNNPGNPTGALYTKDELTEIADVCRKYNTFILADEVYSLLTYDPGSFVSMGKIYPEGTFVIHSLSAGMGAGGFRLGSCIMPEGTSPSIIRDVEKIAATIYTSSAAPLQEAGIAAYRSGEEMDQYLDAVRNIFRIMTSRLAGMCRAIEGIRVTTPRAGFYFMVDMNPLTTELQKAGILYSNDLAPALISHPYHIATVTGEAMMAPYGDFFIRFACTDFDGESALLEYLEKPPAFDEEEAFFEKYGERMIAGMRMFQKWVGDIREGTFRMPAL
ncbi:pyridoxal phosphate-dependent aminotransferase [Methanospirillum sp.]|uniref:pyridoxal phosphate-dependent aminotransferase n=2 Tax=Methanospirillum sp. TaxID=45200 RepID=UPI002CE159AB|nr:pyridoxal phosphate-dependent aminotransferase [Methanospirillum sp.]HPP78071.1 pyridoxal phosphate-dependent aminotransferase [Methanospirillum sp.]